MNRAVCITTWREFQANKVRIIMLTLLFLAPIVIFTMKRCSAPEALNEDLLSHPAMASFFTLLWSAGVIGREVQNGTIALVLSRPISIANYVFSKWFAVGLAASICALEAVFCEHIISAVNCPALLWQSEFLINGFERVLLAFGTAAFLILLSALVSGLKDLALLAGFGFSFMVFASFSSMLHQLATNTGFLSEDCMHGLAKAFEHIFVAIIFPYLQVSAFVSGDLFALGSLVSYLTLVTCSLSLAIRALTSKEFSYAAD